MSARQNSELVLAFSVIGKCKAACEAKMHDALMTKRQNPKLNKQLYAGVQVYVEHWGG